MGGHCGTRDPRHRRRGNRSLVARAPARRDSAASASHGDGLLLGAGVAGSGTGHGSEVREGAHRAAQPAEGQRPVSFITQDTKIIIPLSARTAEQLKQKARGLLEFIRKEASIDLIETAYTLQVGREAMEERLGVLVSSVEQLAEKLEAYLDGEPEITDLYQGQVKRSKASMSIISQDDDLKKTVVDKLAAEKRLSKLLELWVNGLELDWNKLYGEIKPQRVQQAVQELGIDPEKVNPMHG